MEGRGRWEREGPRRLPGSSRGNHRGAGVEGWRGATFAPGGAESGWVPGTSAPRGTANAGTEPGSRRRRYGHPAAGGQDRCSIAGRPPVVLRAQLCLRALVVRAGRGRGGLLWGGGAGLACEGAKRAGCGCASSPEPSGPAPRAGGEGGWVRRTPRFQPEIPFQPAGAVWWSWGRS